MQRRSFLKTSVLAAAGIASAGCSPKISPPSGKTHLLSFSFDDGFRKSFYRAAEIHEEYGMKACFNVIASGHLPEFKQVGEWLKPELLGDFNDWNKLVGRGHEVMPHTWQHLRLTEVPQSLAKENILKCLDYFGQNLDGYTPEEAVYNYAYNASTPELDQFALQHVRAIRTGGWHVFEDDRYAYNPIAEKPDRLGCQADGPGNCDRWVEDEVNKFLASDGGWFIINLHGFDDEGWGPVSTKYFDALLKRLSRKDMLSVLPVGAALRG